MKIRTLSAGLLTLALAGLTASCSKGSDAGSAADGRRVEIAVTAEGYTPSKITAKQGESLVLRFTRKVKGECLAKVVFPEQKITKELPLDATVEVAIKAEKAGKIPFQCGMNMVHGSIDVTGS